MNGLQGGSGEKLRVSSTCKHFVANSLEKWEEYSRHDFDAHVSQQDLFDYYFPPFEECVKEATGVMCSYNALNGRPACANDWLLKEILRKRWGFDGYVTSDCGALADIVTGHHFAVDEVQASALALNATTDLNCGGGAYYPEGLTKALNESWVEESTVKESFSRLARIQFRLGLFDHPKVYKPLDDIRVVDSHDDLAYNAAQQSVVLLKNDGNLLPLQPNQRKLVLIGPHIHASEALLSNYHGDRCGCSSRHNHEENDLNGNDCLQTPLDAIENMNQQPVVGVVGCNVEGNDLDEIEKATQAAEDASIVILVVGIDQSQEKEGLDRTQSTLPGLQSKLIESVLGVASDKTILVMFHGGSLSLGDSIIGATPAIISMPYGGQAASKALVSVLFGEYNPTGRLSATMYPPSYVENNPLSEMGVRPKKGFEGRTHMYYKGTTEFAFGDGLSYSDWNVEFSSQQKQPDIQVFRNSEGIITTRFNITVSNLGPLPGSQNVLLFWQPSTSTGTQSKLLSFRGTSLLRPEQSQVLQFEVLDNAFALWKASKQMMEVLTENRVLVAKVSGGETTFLLPSFQSDTTDVEAF